MLRSIYAVMSLLYVVQSHASVALGKVGGILIVPGPS